MSVERHGELLQCERGGQGEPRRGLVLPAAVRCSTQHQRARRVLEGRGSARRLTFFAYAPVGRCNPTREEGFSHMASTVTLPLWLVVLAGLLSAWAVLDRLLMPSVRWFLRTRANRVLDEVGQ